MSVVFGVTLIFLHLHILCVNVTLRSFEFYKFIIGVNFAYLKFKFRVVGNVEIFVVSRNFKGDYVWFAVTYYLVWEYTVFSYFEQERVYFARLSQTGFGKIFFCLVYTVWFKIFCRRKVFVCFFVLSVLKKCSVIITGIFYWNVDIVVNAVGAFFYIQHSVRTHDKNIVLVRIGKINVAAFFYHVHIFLIVRLGIANIKA